jgi:hypothetical protein
MDFFWPLRPVGARVLCTSLLSSLAVGCSSKSSWPSTQRLMAGLATIYYFLRMGKPSRLAPTRQILPPARSIRSQGLEARGRSRSSTQPTLRPTATLATPWPTTAALSAWAPTAAGTIRAVHTFLTARQGLHGRRRRCYPQRMPATRIFTFRGPRPSRPMVRGLPWGQWDTMVEHS